MKATLTRAAVGRTLPLLLVAACLASHGGAQAQAGQAPALASNVEALPGPAAPLVNVPPAALLEAGTKIVQSIDSSQQATLWLQASLAIRHQVSVDQFSGSVAKLRAGLGAMSSRQWIALSLQQVGTDDAVPPGQYATCEFTTRFAGGRTVEELVTMRLDEDGMWRIAGYVIR